MGRPYYGINCQILNPDPKTSFGEIVAKSRNIFMGFHLDEEKTKEAFTSGTIFFFWKNCFVLNDVMSITLKSVIFNDLFRSSCLLTRSSMVLREVSSELPNQSLKFAFALSSHNSRSFFLASSRSFCFVNAPSISSLCCVCHSVGITAF